MTRSQFVELLESRWDCVATWREVRTPLTRICKLLAVESFIHEQTGEAVDALREQLLHLDKNGRFNFDD